MALLIGMSGPVKGQTFALNKDRTILGRNASNDIVVADEAVSSQHCYIARRGDRYVLRDLNSTNGTIVVFPDGRSVHLVQGQSIDLVIGGAIDLGDAQTISLLAPQ